MEILILPHAEGRARLSVVWIVPKSNAEGFQGSGGLWHLLLVLPCPLSVSPVNSVDIDEDSGAAMAFTNFLGLVCP